MMSVYRVIATGAILVTLPFAAVAQDTTSMTSTITLGYGHSSLDFLGGDIGVNTVSLNFASDIKFGSRVSLGFDVDLSKSDVSISGGGPDVDIDVTRLALEPTYHFGNGVNAGLYYQRGDVDITSLGFPFSIGGQLNSYGLTLGYGRGPWEASLHVGKTDIQPSLGGIDITDYGIAASYDISSNFEIFGQVSRSDINIPGPDIALTLVAIGGDYAFDNGLSVFGTIGKFDVGGVPVDATQIALGLAYDIGQNGSGIPMTLSLEVARTKTDFGPISADIDYIGVGLTIPIGNGASSKPLNTRARAARGDYHTAVFSGFKALGF